MAASDNTSLTKYLDTPVKLFIVDRVLLKQSAEALTKLGFRMISVTEVKNNYFQAMRQLYGELTNHDGVILVNHPPQTLKDSTGRAYQDMTFQDFYSGVGSFNKSARRESSELLRKCVPILTAAQDSDIRQRIIEDLFPFGIIGVFLLGVQPLGMPKADLLEERIHELHDYLLEYFLQKDRKLKEFKEYRSAEELNQRRAQAEELMAKVEELKEAREYDKAIALCREAIETLPTDPEAYLEGGRLLVKKKKYPPAMQMFQDAESVAEELPTPNQEIANMRVTQVKEYVAECKSSGREVDQSKVDGYLGEAADNFEAAVGKAEKITLLRRDRQEDARADAIGAVVENILTSDLADTLGVGNPNVARLAGLAQKTLKSELGEGGEVPPQYKVQYGLMAFQEGDFDTAEKYLFEAAKNPDTRDDACMKLNYLGTQYRQRRDMERAIRVYRDLLELKPHFKGVVLFNLAVAEAAQLSQMQDHSSQRALAIRKEAAGTVVEAFYVDPSLHQDENFYANTVIAPILREAIKGFTAAIDYSLPGDQDPTIRACREAGGKIEQLLAQKQDMQALQYMFGLTQSLKQFFLNFDQYSTPRVLDFARRLLPVLAKHHKPKMVTFGKVLAVLVKKGEATKEVAQSDNPVLKKTFDALNQADQAGASRELVRVVLDEPDLLQREAARGDTTLLNLARESLRKMSGVDFDRFKDDVKKAPAAKRA